MPAKGRPMVKKESQGKKMAKNKRMEGSWNAQKKQHFAEFLDFAKKGFTSAGKSV
jgi:hypothetical protein